MTENQNGKFLIVYKLDNAETSESVEGYEFNGTLNEAIDDATADKRHWNYGRRGVKIYKIEEPVYEKFERE